MAEPHFTMLWAEDIPHRFFDDAEGRTTEVAVIAGRLEGPRRTDAPADAPVDVAQPLAPPPDSWAAQPEAEVAIWTIRMAPGARWKLPAAIGAGVRRKLYFFAGSALAIAGEAVGAHAGIELRATSAVDIVNTGADAAELLMLQGRPIGEPVAQYGPFVMNTEDEVRQAFADYRRTGFGGWPWAQSDPVHGPERVRFARHADGRVETMTPPRQAGQLAGDVPPDRTVMRNETRTGAGRIAENEADPA
jgi:redox-sensitive bicupin YhaK (pirin superfamily)